MKAVALEREKIRQRERERHGARREGRAAAVAQAVHEDMRSNSFNLNKWVGQEEAREKLVQAGYRGQAPYVTFCSSAWSCRSPCSLFSAVLSVRRAQARTSRSMVKLGDVRLCAAYLGMQLP